jgi:hypothetical protein
VPSSLRASGDVWLRIPVSVVVGGGALVDGGLDKSHLDRPQSRLAKRSDAIAIRTRPKHDAGLVFGFLELWVVVVLAVELLMCLWWCRSVFGKVVLAFGLRTKLRSRTWI